MSLFLILTAAGSSSRMGQKGKKEYMPLGGGTVLSCSLKAFLNAGQFTAVVITVPRGGEADARQALSADRELEALLKGTRHAAAGMETDAAGVDTDAAGTPPAGIFFIEGGSSRQNSIYNALLFLKKSYSPPPSNTSEAIDCVLVHDAARPFVTQPIIRDCIDYTRRWGAAVPAIPAVDTQKETAPDGTIARHLDRTAIAAVQTPQRFHLTPFIRCHEKAHEQGLDCTDDTQVWDSFPELTGGKKVHIIPGDIMNKKITYPADLPDTQDSQGTGGLSNTNSQSAVCSQSAAAGSQGTSGLSTIRIGLGTDLHQLVEGRRFLLGGVEIPADKGELGHSDADVLLHAITDALLGASGLGDIGSYFPPEEAKWKDADSSLLLKQVWADVRNAGWELINLDCVVEFEKPKFLPWRQKVIDSVAAILEVTKEQVFVKAKTNEGLDAVGSSRAIKAYCVCLLRR